MDTAQCCESLLGCLTLYTLFACIEPRAKRHYRRLVATVHDANRRLFEPRGFVNWETILFFFFCFFGGFFALLSLPFGSFALRYCFPLRFFNLGLFFCFSFFFLFFFGAGTLLFMNCTFCHGYYYY